MLKQLAHHARLMVKNFLVGSWIIFVCFMFLIVLLTLGNTTGWTYVGSATLYLMLILGVPLVIAVFLAAGLRQKSHSLQLNENNTIISLYEPPFDLTPAEMGYLMDSKFGAHELMATLLDLEQRQHIHLNKHPVIGFTITKTDKQAIGLTEHEIYAMTKLTHVNNVSMALGSATKEFRILVMKSLSEKGFLKRSKIGAHYVLRRTILWNIAITITVFVGLLFSQMGSSGATFSDALSEFWGVSIGLFLFFSPLSFLAGSIFDKIVGHTNVWTKEAKPKWAEIQGYREFVKLVELDRLKFESAELKTATLNRARPYAVAFSFNSDWQKRF